MMKSDQNPPNDPNPSSDSRRRLLRGGLAVAPVVMTVASRPVLGRVACTASAITSINMQSSINHNCSITSGLSPEKWKTLAAQWPTPYSGAGSATGTTGTTTTTTTTTTTRINSNQLLQQQLAGGGTSSTSTALHPERRVPIHPAARQVPIGPAARQVPIRPVRRVPILRRHEHGHHVSLPDHGTGRTRL